MTLLAVRVPVTVPEGTKHGGVPAGKSGGAGFRFEHRKTIIPPCSNGLPKWICACVTVPNKSSYDSS